MTTMTRKEMHGFVPAMNDLNRSLLNSPENVWGLHVVAFSNDNPDLLITMDLAGEGTKVLVINGGENLPDLNDPDTVDEDASIDSTMVFNLVDEVMGTMEMEMMKDFYHLFLNKDTKVTMDKDLVEALTDSGLRLYVASGYEAKVIKIARLS